MQVARTQAYNNARTVRDQLLADQRIDPARDLRNESGGFALLLGSLYLAISLWLREQR